MPIKIFIDYEFYGLKFMRVPFKSITHKPGLALYFVTTTDGQKQIKAGDAQNRGIE